MKEDDIRLRDFGLREGVKSLIVIGYPKEKGLTKANVWCLLLILSVTLKILVTGWIFIGFLARFCHFTPSALYS